MIRRKKFVFRAGTLAGSVMAIWLLAGCQLPLALIEMMFPKEKIPPVYTLPPGKTVLVFPDDILNPLSYSPVKRMLADKVNKLLVEKKLVAGTIPFDKLIDLKNSEPEFNRLAVSTVGKKLGADLVVYISNDEFRLKDTPLDTIWRGRFSVKVRVVDVNEGRLWPDESAGFPVKIVEPITESSSRDYSRQLAEKLAEGMGEKVCGLFCDHYVDRARPKEKDIDSEINR